MANEQFSQEVPHTRVVVIYFKEGSEREMKDLAARVREKKAKTVLVNSAQWRGPESMEYAKAVLIQRGAVRGQQIYEAYTKLAHDVEVHWITDEGEFEDVNDATDYEDTPGPAEVEADPAISDAEESAYEAATDDLGEDVGDDEGEDTSDGEAGQADADLYSAEVRPVGE